MRMQTSNRIITGRNKNLELNPPTTIDIKNTQKLFRDFGVKTDILILLPRENYTTGEIE